MTPTQIKPPEALGDACSFVRARSLNHGRPDNNRRSRLNTVLNWDVQRFARTLRTLSAVPSLASAF